MLAFIYLAIAVVLGDAICRRFITYVSQPHRWATAFLGGLLISSWWTYLGALLFPRSASPLFWGDIFFFATSMAAIWLLRKKYPGELPLPDAEAAGLERWDWLVIGIFFILSCWMMFATFNMSGGMLQIGQHEYADFGSTISVMQSFAQGVNFPTEHPFFSHEPIRAYFLFYFQAGNLEYLGLNPAWSNNILSILSTTALLALVMTLGRVLFKSRVAGRIGAALFFFQGSLSFVPFLRSQTSFSGLLKSLATMTSFLNSGLGHRGEDWGIWSQNVYLTQRNFASSIGLLLIVLIFLLIRYRRAERSADALPSTSEDRSTPEVGADQQAGSWLSLASLRGPLSPFVFCGVLMGLMPMWNGAVLADGLIILGLMLAMFPLRREGLILLAATALLAVPQLIYLKAGARPGNFSFFHWGYLLDDPSLATVLYYLIFTFGFKWLLMGMGVAWSGNLERRFFAAASALLVFAFCTQFTEEILTNHKFFNIWLVIANVYVAYGLVRLWQLRVWSTSVPARVAAALLAISITITGVIDLMPVHNSPFIEMSYSGDKLVDWVKANTDPRSVFLSDRYMNHQILLAGRRLFYGQPYYAGEAGGDAVRRDPIYKTLFESSDKAEVLRLLHEYGIKYVAIDDTIRNAHGFITRPNELVYRSNFKTVFEDADNNYANLRIYEVP